MHHELLEIYRDGDAVQTALNCSEASHFAFVEGDAVQAALD